MDGMEITQFTYFECGWKSSIASCICGDNSWSRANPYVASGWIFPLNQFYESYIFLYLWIIHTMQGVDHFKKISMMMELLLASYFWRMSKCYHTLFAFIITL
ncbi:hypothetical protein IHE45_06G029700 [Dioscorea alata]|uniref:Uncharacterized protein n=1 Tax=Dioscorea alata TaxID=55571 RepID=A0ACB7VVM5_DIOAL|nr:hypothetical protein IHE45_06G029700 [Dioscorea alata]